MKNKNLSWVGALFVFALLLWCTAVTPGKVADPATYTCAVYSTFFSLLPPVIAIVLALNTKEVYTSLLVGIASGALLYANGNLELALNTLFFNEDGGMITKLSDSGNVGILAFLVMLGILVALMNKAGGSAAFGRWASTHIHSRAGAQFATLLLGVMIFVDDYFNCLTVGSVMRPVTDRQKVSRAKLAYLIDSTAAPVCIIAPVSSWAAAVTSSVPEGSGINGFTMFLRTIPYNYYAVLTIVMSLFLIFTGTDFGSMKLNEDNAKNGDLFTTEDRPYGDDVDDGTETKGRVVDLIAPVLVLIAAIRPLHAQDILPGSLSCHASGADCDTLCLYSQRTDTVSVPLITFPAAFRQMKENVLTDSLGILNPFWEKLRLSRLGASADTLRIVHVGDSHIRGHIFPRTIGALMQDTFGAVSYTDVGINGAFCTTFTRPDRIADIAALHPDLLILSFGTNESHNRRYNTMLHYRQMDDLVRMLREKLPNVPMLMTTPPGSYESFRQRRRRRTYKINPRTAVAVQTIRWYADENGLAVWDMYEILGGTHRACLNWQEAGLMRPDHVHYLPEGYVLQGELFYQALLKAYNDYVGY